jgi:hypothetical protein
VGDIGEDHVLVASGMEELGMVQNICEIMDELACMPNSMATKLYIIGDEGHEGE